MPDEDIPEDPASFKLHMVLQSFEKWKIMMTGQLLRFAPGASEWLGGYAVLLISK